MGANKRNLRAELLVGGQRDWPVGPEQLPVSDLLLLGRPNFDLPVHKHLPKALLFQQHCGILRAQLFAFRRHRRLGHCQREVRLPFGIQMAVGVLYVPLSITIYR